MHVFLNPKMNAMNPVFIAYNVIFLPKFSRIIYCY